MNRFVMLLVAVAGVGAPQPYAGLRGKGRQVWIRPGAESLEKMFLFFDNVSRPKNPGYIAEEMLPR